MKIRRYQVEPNHQLSEDWTGSGVFVSMWMDAYSVMVSEAERFIVRTTLDAAKKIPPRSELQDSARLCAGQEVQHALAHQSYEEQYLQKKYFFVTVAKSLNFFNYKVLEPLLPLVLRMHFVSALEHFNAVLAVLAIQEKVLKNKNEASRLFRWHFFEEFEHKNVSFDMLSAIHRNSFERAIVMAILIPMLLIDVGLISILFVLQSPKVWSITFLKELIWFYFSRKGFGRKLISAAWLYADSNFSPRQLPSVNFEESYS
jgi:predicted metal-dependent hydrolase